MPEILELSILLPALPQRIYTAWLNSKDHGAFTGSTAEIDSRVGGLFSAWDGYIQGVTLALEPFHRIIQSWRTSDFPPDSPDSRLEVQFEQVEGGTRLTLIHTHIPDGQAADYKQGWEDYYFSTMREFFSENPEVGQIDP
jgi:activator of HSP90 ATPase